jgi:hypothetical protein
MRWALRVAALIGAVIGLPALAHDAIGADARQAYLKKFERLQSITQSTASPTVRAAAWVDAGRTLDEIRTLLNEDIASHGRTQGLETSILVTQLNASPWRLQPSPQTRLYLANQRPYREALALDARGAHVPLARFMLLKNHFYDSFTDHPLKPLQQDKATLLEMIEHGEWLKNPRNAGTDQAIDSEEVHFILALHYLQARDAGALPVATCVARFGELLGSFRKRWPSSLKLATLEALAP